jgi:hypothetical protein
MLEEKGGQNLNGVYLIYQQHKNYKLQGRFLHILLNEFTHVLNDPNMKHLLASPEIRENTITEIIQCLHCLTG